MLRLSLLLWMFPYAYLIWLGRPYKYSSYGSSSDRVEHYLGRAGTIIIVAVLIVLSILMTMISYGIFPLAFLLLILVIDGILFLARVAYVHHEVKKQPDPQKGLVLWTNPDLWNDEVFPHYNKN